MNIDSEETVMKRDLEPQRGWSTFVGSIALGAAAMYALDPDKGRRRRALARDKVRSVLVDTQHAAGVAARDARHRMQGLQARARRLFWRRAAPDDLRLIERVRARLGRLVSHPHAIQVGAHQGRVTLSGPILTQEVPSLLDAVRGVWGVSDVDNRLDVHERAESIPSLQGAGRRQVRSAMQYQAWAPASRMAAVVGGSMLALEGLRRRTLSGWALFAVGVGLTARAVTNLPVNRLAGIATGRGEARRQMDDDPVHTENFNEMGEVPHDGVQQEPETTPALH